MADLGVVFVGPLQKNLKNLPSDFNRALDIYMRGQAPKVQDYMRHNAPWTDQTGNARNGLFARYNKLSDTHYQIVVFHTMPYGIWLEVRFAGQYRIIVPTINGEGKRIMQGLTGLFGKMQGIA